MKARLLIFCLVFIAAGAVPVVAAIMDDATPAMKVSGNYNGEMEIVLGDTPIPGTTPAVITIEEINYNTVTLNIRNLTVASVDGDGNVELLYVGNVLVNNIPVKGSDPFDLSITGASAVIGNGDFEAEWLGPMLTMISGGSIPVTIETANISNSALELKADIPILGMVVAISYTGTKNVLSIDNSRTDAKAYEITILGNQLLIGGISNVETYTIYSVAGVAVETGITSGEINISGLSRGAYLVKVGDTVHKFIKKD